MSTVLDQSSEARGTGMFTQQLFPTPLAESSPWAVNELRALGKGPGCRETPGAGGGIFVHGELFLPSQLKVQEARAVRQETRETSALTRASV